MSARWWNCPAPPAAYGPPVSRRLVRNTLGGGIRRVRGAVSYGRGRFCAAGCSSRVRGPDSCPCTRRMSPVGGECPRARGMSPWIGRGSPCGRRTWAPRAWQVDVFVAASGAVDRLRVQIGDKGCSRPLRADIEPHDSAVLSAARLGRGLLCCRFGHPTSAVRSSGRIRLARLAQTVGQTGSDRRVPAAVAASSTRCSQRGRGCRSARRCGSCCHPPRRPCAACPAHVWGRP